MQLSLLQPTVFALSQKGNNWIVSLIDAYTVFGPDLAKRPQKKKKQSKVVDALLKTGLGAESVG